MRLTKLKPSKASNLAFRKVKLQREQIESFKLNLIKLLDQIDIKTGNSFCFLGERMEKAIFQLNLSNSLISMRFETNSISIP